MRDNFYGNNFAILSRTYFGKFGETLRSSGIISETKKAVASVDFATYESKNGSKPITAVGMVYVRPAYRSQGLSLELFKRIQSDPKLTSMNQVLVAGTHAQWKIFSLDNLLFSTANVAEVCRALRLQHLR